MGFKYPRSKFFSLRTNPISEGLHYIFLKALNSHVNYPKIEQVDFAVWQCCIDPDHTTGLELGIMTQYYDHYEIQ